MLSLLLIQASTSTPASSPAASKLGNLYDLILAGGPLMVPIALCSVVAVGFLVERMGALSSGRLVPGRFGEELEGALTKGSGGAGAAQSALEYCEGRPKVAIARVLASGFRRWHGSRADIERAVEEAGSREVATLTRRLRPLMIITAIAPLLGLLGTVTGMIKAFQVMALEKGIGKPELLAGGISEALVTTAAGLIVAIPVQVAWYWLRGKVDRFAAATEQLFDRVVGRALDARETGAAREAA